MKNFSVCYRGASGRAGWAIWNLGEWVEIAWGGFRGRGWMLGVVRDRWDGPGGVGETRGTKIGQMKSRSGIMCPTDRHF